MEAVHIALTVLGTGAFIALFSVIVGARMDNWMDVHGAERPKRHRRVSTARATVGMLLVPCLRAEYA